MEILKFNDDDIRDIFQEESEEYTVIEEVTQSYDLFKGWAEIDAVIQRVSDGKYFKGIYYVITESESPMAYFEEVKPYEQVITVYR